MRKEWIESLKKAIEDVPSSIDPRVKRSLEMCIDASERLKMQKHCVAILHVENEVLHSDSLLEEMCKYLLDITGIWEFYVSGYSFQVLWTLVKMGCRVKVEDATVELSEDNWPAKYKMMICTLTS